MTASHPVPGRALTPGTHEHFAHGADIGVQGIGPTLEHAFAQAAMALTEVVTELDRVAPRDQLNLSCEGSDRELLLYEWLNLLVYEMATRRMLFSAFEVHLQGDRLRARILGEPVDVARHQPAVEVKGATLTGLAVHQRQDGAWVARCVVDV